MAGNILFFLGLLLSCALVYRAAAAPWWRTYPLVLCYFLVTLIHSVAGWLVYAFLPAWYPKLRWAMETVYIFLGFGLIWQVYVAIPRQYPGVGRIIKTAAQGIAAVVPILLAAAVGLTPSGSLTLDVLEKNVRVLQALLILLVLGLATYYGIPLSRNLLALTRGYGLYITVFVLRFTFWPLQYNGFWQYVMPVTYLIAQVTWLTGLWRYDNAARDEMMLQNGVATPTEIQIVHLRKQLHMPFLSK